MPEFCVFVCSTLLLHEPQVQALLNGSQQPLRLDIGGYLRRANHYGMTALHFMCAAPAAEYASYAEDNFDVDLRRPELPMVDDNAPPSERLDIEVSVLRCDVLSKVRSHPVVCVSIFNPKTRSRWIELW